MAFLASLKKDISKFKEKAEEKEPIYVPFAEYAKDNDDNKSTDEQKESKESKENKQDDTISIKQEKVCILGAGIVGKSAMTIRMVENEFQNELEPTIECSYTTNITVDGKRSELEIVDTGGSDPKSFKELQNIWIRESNAFLLVYAVDSMATFKAAADFYKAICQIKNEDNVRWDMVLVGNKSDLSQREVTWDMGKAQEDTWGCKFIETSAKTGDNVHGAFKLIVAELRKEKCIKQVSFACISDMHLRLKELKMVSADILVVSGDFTCKGSLAEAKTVNDWFGEMKQQFGYKYIVAISGNHEGYGDILINDELLAIENGETLCIGDTNKQKQYEQQELIRIKTQKYLHQNVMTNVTHYLYDEAVIIEGIKFYGTPWSPNLLDPQDRSNKKHFDRGFHADVPGMKVICDKIPVNVEYLIIHGPPQGVLDINGKGCSMLRLKLAELEKLRVCQFGHVHSGYGWSMITKQSIKETVKHIDKTQEFKRTDFKDVENVKYNGDLPFPIKFDVETRSGKTLKQYKKKKKFKKAVKEKNIDVMKDVALFVNAATDGMEQPIHFRLPIYCKK
eukprot:536367_1